MNLYVSIPEYILIQISTREHNFLVYFSCIKQLVHPTRSGYMVDMLRSGKYVHLCPGYLEVLCKQLFTLGCHLHLAIVKSTR